MPRCVALKSYLARLEDVRSQIAGTTLNSNVWGSTASFLERLQRRLMRPPRIAIVGETNTGKSSLANLLLGQELLVTDIVNNTRAPIVIRYADRARLCALESDGTRKVLSLDAIGSLDRDAYASLELGLPLAQLKKFEIIDTPGVSVLAEDSERTAFVCRQADMAIWCTLATQAWRASERDIWQMVCERTRSTSVLAVTHADTLSGADQSRVYERLQREAGPLFSSVAMVSQPDATTAAHVNGPNAVDFTQTFQGKVDAALERVEERRLTGARRAVQAFNARVEGKLRLQPIEQLRIAS